MIEYITSNSIGFAAIGAAIAIGACGLATGIGESKIGKKLINEGVIEKDFGKALVFMSIVESPVIYGFTIALLIVGAAIKIGLF